MGVVKNSTNNKSSAREGVEKREPSYTVTENVKVVLPLCQTIWRFGNKQRLKIEPPCDLAIPLLGIYPEKVIIQRDACT